jgi:tellurite resistance protein TehA-like permease
MGRRRRGQWLSNKSKIPFWFFPLLGIVIMGVMGTSLTGHLPIGIPLSEMWKFIILFLGLGIMFYDRK